MPDGGTRGKHIMLSLLYFSPIPIRLSSNAWLSPMDDLLCSVNAHLCERQNNLTKNFFKNYWRLTI